MKKILQIFGIWAIGLSLTSCEADNDLNNANGGAFPTTFTVDIPSSISKKNTLKNIYNNFDGKDIYRHLNNFMYIGESAAEIIENIMKGISSYDLNCPQEFSYVSNDDNATKNLIVVKNAEFENSNWQLNLTITDAISEANEDGGKALQVYWNTNPVNGIAILKPAYWDKTESSNTPNTLFRVDYSEAGENGYEAEMTVYITGWEEDLNDRFHMNNLKLFVGKNGDIINVYGNSNHPDAYLFLENPTGFNWAFVASGNVAANIGVSEVGLPLSVLDTTDRFSILADNSIQNVFTSQLNEYWYIKNGIYPSEEELAIYLKDTKAPGFFNSAGFIQSGEAPLNDFDALVKNIELLTPYNPADISTLKIEFGK